MRKSLSRKRISGRKSLKKKSIGRRRKSIKRRKSIGRMKVGSKTYKLRGGLTLCPAGQKIIDIANDYQGEKYEKGEYNGDGNASDTKVSAHLTEYTDQNKFPGKPEDEIKCNQQLIDDIIDDYMLINITFFIKILKSFKNNLPDFWIVFNKQLFNIISVDKLHSNELYVEELFITNDDICDYKKNILTIIDSKSSKIMVEDDILYNNNTICIIQNNDKYIKVIDFNELFKFIKQNYNTTEYSDNILFSIIPSENVNNSLFKPDQNDATSRLTNFWKYKPLNAENDNS